MKPSTSCAQMFAITLALSLGSACSLHDNDSSFSKDPAVARALTHGIENEYRVLERRVELDHLVSDARVKQGYSSVSIGKRAPHKISFQTREDLTRGAGDTTLELLDETDGTASLFTVSDDGASVQAETGTGSASIAVNADGSYLVDGKRFDNATLAAQGVAHSSAVLGISPEAAAVLADLTAGNGLLEGTSRAAAAAAIVVVVWIAVSTWICDERYSANGCESKGLGDYCLGWCDDMGCACDQP